MTVNYIPDGYHTITPYLVLEKVAEFLDFAREVFDAVESERQTRPDGSIMHAEVKIGDSRVMMGGVKEGWDPVPGFFYLYVPDSDAMYERALKAGATSLQEPKDEFYGDRSGGVRDPFGNLWWFATHKEDVSSEEIARRASEHALPAKKS